MLLSKFQSDIMIGGQSCRTVGIYSKYFNAPNEHLIFPNSHSIFLKNLGVFSCCSEYSVVRVSTNLLSFSYLFPTMPKMLEGRWCTDPKIYSFCLLSFHLKFIHQFFLNPSPPKVWTAKQFKIQESLK